jgi:hypothetical protein
MIIARAAVHCDHLYKQLQGICIRWQVMSSGNLVARVKSNGKARLYAELQIQKIHESLGKGLRARWPTYGNQPADGGLSV